MAEFVEYRTEEMIPELEELERLRIFEEHEIRAIVKARKNFEYKIQKQVKSKDDYVKYIQYEMDLLKFVRIRKTKLGLSTKDKEIDMSIANRVNKLFKQAVFQFHDDIRLWLSYMRFCEKIPAFGVCVGYMLVGMLAVHSHKAQLWKLAATWEYEHNASVESARQFLLKGLKHHPDSKLLYMEAFRLELAYSEAKRKETGGIRTDDVKASGNAEATAAGGSTGGSGAAEAAVAGSSMVGGNAADGAPGPSTSNHSQGGLEAGGVVSALAAWGGDGEDSPLSPHTLTLPGEGDPVLDGRLAEFIYESASKRIPDVSFLISMLNIAKNFSFTEKLQTRMVKDLMTRFPTDELTWDAMARCELEGMHYAAGGKDTEGKDQQESDLTLAETRTAEQIVRVRIRSCCQVYQLGLQQLGTERMWSLYLDTLIHLYKNPGSLRKFKRKLLREALQKGHSDGRLQEKYYLQWTALHQGKKEKLAMVLRAATERHPGSVALWEMRLHFLIKSCDDSIMSVFKQAMESLGSSDATALPLWKIVIQYWQTKNTDKAEEVFLEGIKKEPAISSALKPMFLEWLVLAKNLSVARQFYQSVCKKPPFCKELHTKMAELECLAPEVEFQYVVICYELACEQFGKESSSVWMEYIKFERQHDPKKVKDVYRRALAALNGDLAHSFINEFCEYWVMKDL